MSAAAAAVLERWIAEARGRYAHWAARRDELGREGRELALADLTLLTTIRDEIEDLDEEPCDCPVVHEADCPVALEDEETDAAMASEYEEEETDG